MNKRFISILAALLTFTLSLPAQSLLSKSSVEEELEGKAAQEGLAKPSSEAKIDAEIDKLDKNIAAESKAGPVAEPEAPKKTSLFSHAGKAAAAAAASIDWSNISWDKISEIPYDDKAQLLAWAGSQVDDWKEKLAKAALTKGAGSINNLSDSGWQGALKQVVAALDQVRKSNPETWAVARGALVSAWDKFEGQATQYLTGK